MLMHLLTLPKPANEPEEHTTSQLCGIIGDGEDMNGCLFSTGVFALTGAANIRALPSVVSQAASQSSSAAVNKQTLVYGTCSTCGRLHLRTEIASLQHDVTTSSLKKVDTCCLTAADNGTGQNSHRERQRRQTACPHCSHAASAASLRNHI